jgi:hypothetical protein
MAAAVEEVQKLMTGFYLLHTAGAESLTNRFSYPGGCFAPRI